MKEILSALINLLMPNEINLDNQMAIIGIKILRKIIEIENP